MMTPEVFDKRIELIREVQLRGVSTDSPELAMIIYKEMIGMICETAIDLLEDARPQLQGEPLRRCIALLNLVEDVV